MLRIVQDFEDMPRGMRKSMNAEMVGTLWEHASAFVFAMRIFKMQVDNTNYEAEAEELEKKYLNHYLDADLVAEVQVQCAFSWRHH